MIEVPRAAVTADEMAETAEFFSFGTNDLTQMTFGYSRDDVEQLPAGLPEEGNPRARPVPVARHRRRRPAGRDGRPEGPRDRPDLKCGICGEHGGDPKSVEFCHQVGLNYVSCSPFRVPIARLAAAHAAIKESQANGGSGGRRSNPKTASSRANFEARSLATGPRYFPVAFIPARVTMEP